MIFLYRPMIVIKNSNRNILCILFLFLINCSSLLYAQEGLSLSDAIQKSLDNNYQIKITNEREKIAQLNNHPAETGMYPRIVFNLSQANHLNSINNPSSFLKGFYTSSNLNGGIQADWTIFDGFKVNLSKQRLQTLEKQSKNEGRFAVENTIYQTILNYYKTSVEKEKLKVMQDLLNISEKRLATERYKKRMGTVSDFEVLQFENAYLADSASLLLQESYYEMALQDLLIAMGEELNKKYELLDPLDKGQKRIYIRKFETPDV